VFLTSYEFYGFKQDVFSKSDRIVFSGVAVVVFLFAFIIASGEHNTLFVILLVPIFLVVDFLFLMKDRTRLLPKLSYGITGWVYIAIPFSILNFIAYHFNDQDFSSLFLVSLFGIIWINDTFAYLAGKFFGRHPLFYRISPKKTLEGFLGGLLFSVLAAWGISMLTSLLNLNTWLLIGLISSLTGSLGDLTESAFKRNVNIKDSGNLLPGHGGFLDRFDAALFVFPSVYFLLLLTSNIS